MTNLNRRQFLETVAAAALAWQGTPGNEWVRPYSTFTSTFDRSCSSAVIAAAAAGAAAA